MLQFSKNADNSAQKWYENWNRVRRLQIIPKTVHKFLYRRGVLWATCIHIHQHLNNLYVCTLLMLLFQLCREQCGRQGRPTKSDGNSPAKSTKQRRKGWRDIETKEISTSDLFCNDQRRVLRNGDSPLKRIHYRAIIKSSIRRAGLATRQKIIEYNEAIHLSFLWL